MSELVYIKTPDWDLTILGNGVEDKQQKLSSALQRRSSVLPHSSIQFSAPIQVEQLAGTQVNPISALVSSVALTKPVFFENSSYEFEFLFHRLVDDPPPCIAHKLERIADAFHFSERRGQILRGTINTGNDVGQLVLPLVYQRKQKHINIKISITVHPLKMDMESDLNSMYWLVDAELPLWRFSFANLTEQGHQSSTNERSSFPLLWLAHFQELQRDLIAGVKRVINSPHTRLVERKKSQTADRIVGKVTPRLAEKICDDIRSGSLNKKYRVNKKHLSIDTPENRFIKMVLANIVGKLEYFEQLGKNVNNNSQQVRLSKHYFTELAEWKGQFVRFRQQAFFKEVGEYRALSKASLVLQQKAGYSAVYRVWQELKLYLDVLGNHATISVKSMAELYEIWCFLLLKRILVEELGFQEKQSDKAKLALINGELTSKDGFYGAYVFDRQDGVKIKLVHEPRFSQMGCKSIFSYTTTQKPDIFLEVTFPNGNQFIWLFDAKYRIDSDNYGTIDKVPEDSINQMHRYRDALIHRSESDGVLRKSRPVFGAFALYPGYFEQSEQTASDNFYAQWIDEMAIGAFPLLPCDLGSNQGHAWLSSFLKNKIGTLTQPHSPVKTENLYLEEAVRIPYRGMYQALHSDLTLIVSGPPKKKGNLSRDSDYLDGFESGRARFLHLKQEAFTRKGIERHIITEIKQCVVAVYDSKYKSRVCRYVWPVINVTLKKRNEMSVDQTGVLDDSPEEYWLLEFGAPTCLVEPIHGFPAQGHYSKLISYRDLSGYDKVFEIPARYSTL